MGEVLKELRERAALSQSTLARKIGITQAQMSRLESGDRKDPGFETIARIARVTGASLDQIALDAGYLGEEAIRRPSLTELRGMSRGVTRARDALKRLDRDLNDVASRLELDRRSP